MRTDDHDHKLILFDTDETGANFEIYADANTDEICCIAGAATDGDIIRILAHQLHATTELLRMTASANLKRINPTAIRYQGKTTYLKH